MKKKLKLFFPCSRKFFLEIFFEIGNFEKKNQMSHKESLIRPIRSSIIVFRIVNFSLISKKHKEIMICCEVFSSQSCYKKKEM